jgi:hypothetical protein
MVNPCLMTASPEPSVTSPSLPWRTLLTLKALLLWRVVEFPSETKAPEPNSLSTRDPGHLIPASPNRNWEVRKTSTWKKQNPFKNESTVIYCTTLPYLGLPNLEYCSSVVSGCQLPIERKRTKILLLVMLSVGPEYLLCHSFIKKKKKKKNLWPVPCCTLR